MNDEHILRLINIENEDMLSKIMDSIESHINNSVLSFIPSPNPYGTKLVDEANSKAWNQIENYKLLTKDFIKYFRIIGFKGKIGINIWGRDNNMSFSEFSQFSQSMTNTIVIPDTKQIFEEIQQIKNKINITEFLENYNEDMKLSKLYSNASVVFFNACYHYRENSKSVQEKIYKYIKLHKIIYANKIQHRNVFCVNVYGFIIITNYSAIDKELIYSKEKKVSIDYINKYIESFYDLYNRYQNFSPKHGENIFDLEQKIKEKELKSIIEKKDTKKTLSIECISDKKEILSLQNTIDELKQEKEQLLMKNEDFNIIDKYKMYCFF